MRHTYITPACSVDQASAVSMIAASATSIDTGSKLGTDVLNDNDNNQFVKESNDWDIEW